MFGIFGVTKDAKVATNYLLNFVEFVQRTVEMFGFEKAIAIIGQSEWAAGTQLGEDRSITSIHFRLSIPLETFYATVDNETEIHGSPSQDSARIDIKGIDKFQGFGFYHYTEKKLMQTFAVNGLDRKATTRAMMLAARLKTYGAVDISNALRGKW